MSVCTSHILLLLSFATPFHSFHPLVHQPSFSLSSLLKVFNHTQAFQEVPPQMDGTLSNGPIQIAMDCDGFSMDFDRVLTDFNGFLADFDRFLTDFDRSLRDMDGLDSGVIWERRRGEGGHIEG